jgi:hypothetical protein
VTWLKGVFMLKSPLIEPADKIRLIATITLIGFVLAAFFHGFIAYFHLGYPWDTFLFQPWDRFMDFFNVYELSKDLNPYFSNKWYLSNYFPAAYLLFYPLTWISDPAVALVLFLGIFCYFLCWHTDYYLQKFKTSFNSLEYIQAIVILCFLSYPVLICLDRGTGDAFLFIVVALFIIAFIKKHYIVAAVLLAVAAGMKLFPFVFLVLFVKEKRFYEGTLCVVLAILLSVIALLCFSGGILGNLEQYFINMHNFNNTYIIYDGALSNSVSLFSFIKVIIHYCYINSTDLSVDWSYRHTIRAIMPYYIVSTFLVFGMIAWYVYVVEKVFWRQVMLLVLVQTLLPVMSGDYRLVFIFIPLLLFVVSSEHDRLNKFYAILFGLLLIPKNYFIFPQTSSVVFQKTLSGQLLPVLSNGGYSVMCALNVVILLVFMMSIMLSGIKKYYFSNALDILYENG